MESESECTLADLEHDAEALLSDLHSGCELPRVQRSLHQMRSAGEKLATRAAAATNFSGIGIDQHSGASNSTYDVMAARLLAERGHQLPRLPLSLETNEGLQALATFESLEPCSDTDIQSFLKNERDNALLTAIENTRKQTFDECEERCLQSLQDDWESEKQRILNALVGPNGTNELPEMRTSIRFDDSHVASLLLDSYSGSVNQSGTAQSVRTILSATELALSRALDLYTATECAGATPPDICSKFLEAITNNKCSGGDAQELWSMVKKMCSVECEVGVAGGGSPLEVRCSRKYQEAWIRCALSHLEESFRAYLQAAVLQSLPRAQLGGVPGPRALVRAFVALKLANSAGSAELEDGVVEGRPVWPLIYFCLRAGEAETALQIAREASNNLAEFTCYLEEYLKDKERRLSTSSETKLRLLYRRTVKAATDPYKRVVYCILARCDPLEYHVEVSSDTESFLWLKLLQISWSDTSTGSVDGSASASSSSPSVDGLSLPQLQRLITEEFGENHFRAWEQPLLYFALLFLTQQFEAALVFLASTESARCHAVHAALALYERRLLLISPSLQVQLLSHESTDPPTFRRLNLARLVMLYTRKFETSDPREVLNYYYMLRDLRTPSSTAHKSESLFVKCVAELALETSEFELILGKLDMQSGNRLPGAVDRYQVDVQRLISSVGSALEQRGRLEEAAQVLELAGEDARLVTLLCQLMAGCIALPPSSPERARLLELARGAAARLRHRGNHTASALGVASLYHLLDLASFFELYHSGELDAALNLLDELRVLPTSSVQVEAKVAAFSRLSDDVRRALPELLPALMSILLTKYLRIRQAKSVLPTGSGSPTSSSTTLSEFRMRAAALVAFAGRLPYRMPGDVYARLSQMEIQMS